MNKDIKTVLMSVTSILIGGTIIYYTYYKPTTGSVGIVGNAGYKNSEVLQLYGLINSI